MIKAIAYDLDDTLIDTSGLLVPAAAAEACRAMKSAGMDCSIAECLEWRAELAPNHSHREIFNLIADRTGAKDPAKLGDVGSQKFYNPPIPQPLQIMAGGDDVMTKLRLGYLSFLVTSGAPETQWKKIRAAKLEGRFDGIFVVDKFKGENKGSVFQQILEQWQLKPENLLSVGNRLREEIRHAKRLGCKTCYFEYGEHVGEIAELPEDVPDYRVRRWSEFLVTCKL